MEQSDSITELAGALANAQAKLKAAEMTAINPFLKNKYADLGEVIKASRAALTENGLSIVQPVSSNGEMVIVTTQLMHASGQWIRDTMAFPLTEQRGKSLAQEAGSIITYLRRYSLASMIGIYADDDTDGNEPKPATKRPAATGEEPPVVERKPEPMRQTQPPEPTLPAAGWPIELISTLEKDFRLVPQRVRNALNLSNIDPDAATIDECREWLMRYKTERETGKTPQEAAETVNDDMVEARSKRKQ